MKEQEARHLTAGRSRPYLNLACEGIAIVDANSRLVAVDRGAQAILDDVNAHGGKLDPRVGLPQPIVDMLTARPEGALDAGLLRISDGNREYSCRAFNMRPRNGEAQQTMLVLYLKRELSVADAVHQISTDYHLTEREQEALIGVSMGLTSKELATRMKISPNTVKAFLRLIMIKMGTTTRAGTVGKLLDQNSRTSDARMARGE